MCVNFYCLIFYVIIVMMFIRNCNCLYNDVHSEKFTLENNLRKNVLDQIIWQESKSPVRASDSGLKIEADAPNLVPINQASNQPKGRHFKIKKKAHPEGYSFGFSDEKKSIGKNQRDRHGRLVSGTKRQAENSKDALTDQKTSRDISGSYFRAGPPEHVGDSARLRFDFVRPASNGSCPNFQGSAEVVAGQWQLPPNVPVIFTPDWTQDQMPQEIPQQPQIPPKLQPTGNSIEMTTTSTTTTTTVMTTTAVALTTSKNKKKGFFKEIQDFIKHSLHMDKPKNSTDSITPPIRTPEIAQSSLALQHPPLSDGILQKGHEDRRTSGSLHGRNRFGFSKMKLRPLGGHREATFNLRIKGIAIPKLSENKMIQKSLRNEKGVSNRGPRTTIDENIVEENEAPSALKIYLKKVTSFSGKG